MSPRLEKIVAVHCFLFLMLAVSVTALVNGDVVSPVNDSFLNGTVTINITFSGTVNITIENGTNGASFSVLNTSDDQASPYAFSWDTSAITDGTNYTLRVNVTNATNATEQDSILVSNLTIDNTPPALTINAPASGANLSNGTVTFNWTATDTLDANLSCPLTVNGTVNQTVTGNGTLATSVTFADGTYNWSVSCLDDTGNSNTSTTRTFTVDTTAPNVSASSRSVTNSSAVINATSDDAANFTVFYGTTSGSLGTVVAGGSGTTATNVTLSSLSASTTYFFVVQGCDSVSNCANTTEANFTTSAAAATTSSGGGGGGGGGFVTNEVSGMPASATISIYGKYIFTLPGNPTRHEIVIDEILEDGVRFTIRSDPVSIFLKEGETKSADIDGDGKPDIALTLVSFSGASARLEVSTQTEREDAPETAAPPVVLSEEVSPQESEPAPLMEGGSTDPSDDTLQTTQENVAESKRRSTNGAVWFGALILLLIVGGTWYLTKK